MFEYKYRLSGGAIVISHCFSHARPSSPSMSWTEGG